MGSPGSTEHDKLLQAVEQLASIMAESGLPRMAARVFAYALADDGDRYSAAELAQGLRVSPAAISGAVRFLMAARLIFKEREPGTRADLYRIADEDVWSTIMVARIPALELWEKGVADAAARIGREHRGARRLRETEEFFRFTREETAAMVERWKARRRSIG